MPPDAGRTGRRIDARISRRGPALAAAAVGVVALGAVGAVVVVPVWRLVAVSFEQGPHAWIRLWTQPALTTAVWHTALLAIVVPLIAVPLGVLFALLLRRPDVPLARTLRVLVLLPLIVPQFVLGYSWRQAYGRAGFVDSLFGFHWAGLDGVAGIVVVMVVDAVPLIVVLTTVGLGTRAQPDLEQAARLSGATEWSVLRTVTLPLLRPVILAATVLTVVGALGAFAVPQVLGSATGFTTVTTRIYASLARGSDPTAFLDSVTLSLLLVIVALALLTPADTALTPRLRTQRSVGSGGYRAPGGERAGSAGRGIAACIVLFAATGTLLPMLALVSAALTKAIGLAPTPANWSSTNFRSALSRPMLAALEHSLLLATGAASILVVLGVVLTLLERRAGGRLLGTVALLTFAIPGSTLAVGLLLGYGKLLRGSLLLILLAYLAKFWALAHRAISGAAERLPAAELAAARCSGAGAGTAFRTVWLPAMAPALIGGWLLVFVTALHEVTMSSLLYSFGTETLAVAVLNRQELGDIGTTAALSVLLTLVMLAAAAAGWLIVPAVSRRASRVRREVPVDVR